MVTGSWSIVFRYCSYLTAHCRNSISSPNFNRSSIFFAFFLNFFTFFMTKITQDVLFLIAKQKKLIF